MAEPNTRRRDAATASTGAVLLGSGGVMRHAGVRHGFGAKKPKVHALGMMRAPHGKRLFWGGSALGALGLTPLAVGSTRLAQGSKVDKADKDDELGRRRERNEWEATSRRAEQSRNSPANRAFISRMRANPRHQIHYRVPGTSRLACGHPRRDGLSGMSVSTTQIPHRITCPKCKGQWLKKIPPISKVDDSKRGFWREGLSGTREALGERAQSYKDPVPTKLRAAQLGVGAGAGAVGSFAARAALGRRGNALKPLLTPVAGGLAATASVPLSNRYVHRHHPDYQITPAGVRRRKKDPVKPSSKSSQYRPMPRSLRQDLSKAQSYQGSRTPYIKQRAAITAAGHPPVIGPFTAAAAAARYAPPGQERKQAARQWAMGSGAGFPIGVGGAYAGAHLAQHSRAAEGVANDVVRAKRAVHSTARRAVGLGAKTSAGPGKHMARFLATSAGKPFRTKAGAAGGAAGFLGAKMASGGVLGQTAITMNQRDQRRYNKAHHIEKAQTKREKHNLATQKRRTAALSTASGLLGLSSLGLIATGHRNAALTTGTIGSGIGGTNSLLGARVQRQEAKNVDPVKKGLVSGTPHWHLPKDGVIRSGGKWLSTFRDRENPLESVHYLDPEDMEVFAWTRDRLKAHSSHRPGSWTVIARTKEPRHVYASRRRNNVAKAGALAIQGTPKEHAELIHRYGDRGPLPKTLDRNTRMKAYEARYVHHGGDKQNRWARRATTGDRLKNAGLGIGTAGGAAWLATRGKRGAKVLAKHPHLQRRAENVAVAGATVGGAGEMLAGYAHRKQASYANSPGGVAASALRRMRAYSPEDQ